MTRYPPCSACRSDFRLRMCRRNRRCSGAILANNKALDRCHGLETEHFADPIHGRIFETVRKLVDAGHIADAVTLKTTFELPACWMTWAARSI